MLECVEITGLRAAVTFFWAAIPARMEWRYDLAAHKVIALDAGHVCQNLYLACESLDAGVCAIAAYDQDACDRLLGVDGDEEIEQAGPGDVGGAELEGGPLERAAAPPEVLGQAVEEAVAHVGEEGQDGQGVVGLEGVDAAAHGQAQAGHGEDRDEEEERPPVFLLDGVTEARTSYARGTTEVSFDPSRVTVETIIDTIAHAGFTAEAVAPSILWLDEIEKGFSGTKSSGESDAGTTARVFASFITWLQEKSTPVFVIATANDVSMLPPELLRKGRFDEIFFVDLPGPDERADIFRIQIDKVNRRSRVKRDLAAFDVDAIVAGSQGYSGAEIEQAVTSALYDAFEQGEDLTTGRILRSLSEQVPLSFTMKEKIDAMRDWADGRARRASPGAGVADSRHVERIEMT